MKALEIQHGNIIQTAFTVPDLAAGVRDYGKLLNIGSWVISRKVPFSTFTYRGTPATLNVAVALAFQGDAMYELIQPLSDEPSVYKETIDKTGYGLHHFGIVVASVEEQLRAYRAQGFEVPLEATTISGGRVAYADTSTTLPAMLEFLQDDAGVRALLKMVHAKQSPFDGAVNLIER